VLAERSAGSHMPHIIDAHFDISEAKSHLRTETIPRPGQKVAHLVPNEPEGARPLEVFVRLNKSARLQLKASNWIPFARHISNLAAIAPSGPYGDRSFFGSPFSGGMAITIKMGVSSSFSWYRIERTAPRG
jgi:hypothetical protein